jgi:hypothetical protein
VVEVTTPAPAISITTHKATANPGTLSESDWGDLFIAVLHARDPDDNSPWTAWFGGRPYGTCGPVPAKIGDTLDCDIVDSGGSQLLPPLVSQIQVKANGEFVVASAIDLSHPDPSLFYPASDYGISWTNLQNP